MPRPPNGNACIAPTAVTQWPSERTKPGSNGPLEPMFQVPETMYSPGGTTAPAAMLIGAPNMPFVVSDEPPA